MSLANSFRVFGISNRWTTRVVAALQPWAEIRERRWRKPNQSHHKVQTVVCRTLDLDFSAQHILHVCLADLCALFRGPGFVRHTVQLDHGPAAELDLLKCNENSWKIYSATAEFSPAIGAPALIRSREAFDVLDMQKEE